MSFPDRAPPSKTIHPRPGMPATNSYHDDCTTDLDTYLHKVLSPSAFIPPPSSKRERVSMLLITYGEKIFDIDIAAEARMRYENMTPRARRHCNETTGVHESFATKDKLTDEQMRIVKHVKGRLRKEICRIAAEDQARETRVQYSVDRALLGENCLERNTAIRTDGRANTMNSRIANDSEPETQDTIIKAKVISEDTTGATIDDASEYCFVEDEDTGWDIVDADDTLGAVSRKKQKRKGWGGWLKGSLGKG